MWKTTFIIQSIKSKQFNSFESKLNKPCSWKMWGTTWGLWCIGSFQLILENFWNCGNMSASEKKLRCHVKSCAKTNQPCSWRMLGTWGLWCRASASPQSRGVFGIQKSPEQQMLKQISDFTIFRGPFSPLHPPTILAMSTQGPMRLLK